MSDPARRGRFILETDRLILREFTPDDFAALCLMLQDDEVMYAYEGALSDEEAHAWLDIVGQCGLTYQDGDGRGTRVVEVGYLFQRAHWHRGLATEAARACRDYAFDQVGVEKVYSIIRDTNVASQRVARRNGMVPEGSFVKRYRGVDMPHLVFSIPRAGRDGVY